MDKFQLGARQAILEIVGGLITPPVVDAMTQGEQVPGWAIAWFGLALALANIILMFSMPSWGVLYTLGWIFGSFLLLSSGALGFLGVVLYIVAPIVCLVGRFLAVMKS